MIIISIYNKEIGNWFKSPLKTRVYIYILDLTIVLYKGAQK